MGSRFEFSDADRRDHPERILSAEPLPDDAPVLPSRTERRVDHLGRIANLQISAVALVLAVGLLWLLSDVVLLLFASTLIACQLYGAAHFVARRTRVPYALALAAVVAILVGLVAVFVWARGPALVVETATVAGDINAQMVRLWQSFGDAKWLQDAFARVQTYVHQIHVTGYAAGFVTSTLGNFGSLLLIVVAAVYLAASPHIYVDGIVSLTPGRWRSKATEVLEAEAVTLRWWFLGQLVDMAVIGLLTGAGLFLLGVKLWPTLGLIAALCNFVPYIGALAGSVPAILVAFSLSPQTALYVAILFAAVQTLEGNVIAPLIQRRTVDLPPVVTLLSQTVLGTLFGPFGLILATPITAAATVLVRKIYIETILCEEPEP